MNICVLMQQETEWIRKPSNAVICSSVRTLHAMCNRSYTRVHNTAVSERSKSYSSLFGRKGSYIASISRCLYSNHIYSTIRTKDNVDIKCSATWTKKKVLNKIKENILYPNK